MKIETKEMAQEIALRIIRKNVEKTAGEVKIIADRTEKVKNVWVFFYDSVEYIETGNFSACLLGNDPLLVQHDGNFRFLTWAAFQKERRKHLPPEEITLSGISRVARNKYIIKADRHEIPLLCIDDALMDDYFIHIGDLDASDLEIPVDSRRMEICGFKLFSFAFSGAPRANPALPRITGYPLLKAERKLFTQEHNKKHSMGIWKEFSVGIGHNFMEVNFGGISDASHIIVAGPMEFYVHAKIPCMNDPDLVMYNAGMAILTGMRITGLKKRQTSILKHYDSFYNSKEN